MDNLELVNPALLPPRIRELVAIIGLPETLVLLQHCGGVPCHIPSTTDRSHLKHVLQPASMAALADSRLAGRVIEMPKPDKILTQIRNLAVRAKVQQVGKLRTAREFRLSRRHVINLCRDADDDPMLDLFGEPGTE